MMHCQPFTHLCALQNVVVLLLLSGLQMCSRSGRRRGVVVVKVRMERQRTLRSGRHRDMLSSAIVHCNGNNTPWCLSSSRS